MIINYHGKENFTVKTRGKTLKIGENVSLGDMSIQTAGEYESGGVQLEIIDGIIEILSEKMSVAWMKKAKLLKDEELEKVNGIDILLIGVGGGDFTETKTAIEVINQIEPAVVIPMYSQNLESFTKEEGISISGEDQLKINYNELPQEERKVIVLNVIG